MQAQPQQPHWPDSAIDIIQVDLIKRTRSGTIPKNQTPSYECVLLMSIFDGGGCLPPIKAVKQTKRINEKTTVNRKQKPEALNVF